MRPAWNRGRAMADTYERWWLVTWTTYGTWLPGDPRGFQTWRGREYVPPPQRYANPEEAIYQPEPYQELHQRSREVMTELPSTLAPAERKVAAEAMVTECTLLPLVPSVLAVEENHVHLLLRVGSYSLRTAAGRLKAAASRHLHTSGFSRQKIWCQGCHLKSKDDARALRAAFDYVRRHEDAGAMIHVWRHPFDPQL